MSAPEDDAGGGGEGGVALLAAAGVNKAYLCTELSTQAHTIVGYQLPVLSAVIISSQQWTRWCTNQAG